MADTYTSLLRLRKLAVGAYSDAWAPVLNEVLAVAEQSIAGAAIISVTAGNATLSSANGTDDNARRMFVYATGAQGVTTRTITVPDTSKVYVFVNDSALQVTFQRVSGGTTLVVQAGQCCFACVTAAGIFEVPPLGTPATDAAAMTALTLNIGGTHGAGDATVAMKYIVQGSFCFARILAHAPLNFSNALFTIKPTADWPADMTPAVAQRVPVNAQENGALVDAYIVTSTAVATAWSIVKASGAAWLATGTDDRAVHAISFTYPLRGI